MAGELRIRLSVLNFQMIAPLSFTHINSLTYVLFKDSFPAKKINPLYAEGDV